MFIIDREGEEIVRLVASVRPSVSALTHESFDLQPRFLTWVLTLTLARLGLYVKVVGQSSRSHCEKMCLVFDLIFCCLWTCFEVKIKGQGQSSRSIMVDNGTWLCQVQQKVQWNTNQVHFEKHYRVFISRGVQNGCVSNLLLFRQVAASRSVTVLMLTNILRCMRNKWMIHPHPHSSDMSCKSKLQMKAVTG